MSVPQLEARRAFSWPTFVIIAIAGMIGVGLVIPYSLATQGSTLETLEATLQASGAAMPASVVIAISIAQNAVLVIAASGIGLLLAARTGLGAPFIEYAVRGQPAWRDLLRVVPLAIGLGVAAGAVIALLDVFVFAPVIGARLAVALPETLAGTGPTALQGFLASFYGGITEEVLLRLFVMTLLAWLGGFAARTPEGRPAPAVLWTANILAALLFGLGHLPALAQIGFSLDAVLVLRTVLLNALGGIVFGWLYVTRGLESAMIAHFSADLVLHVLTPLIAAALGAA